MDLEKGTSIQVFAPSDIDTDMPISALDMAHSEPNMLYFSTLDGATSHRDRVARQNHEDMGYQKISGKGDLRHPALLGEHESRLSVSHASWSAAGHIATSSYDDTIKIYDLATQAAGRQDTTYPPKQCSRNTRIHHNNQTGRWVTILKPQWQRRPHDGIQKFVIANMNRFVDVFASDGSQLAQLDGEGITAVARGGAFHPTLDWVAGGNGSGKLCLWQ
ncbi:hypothetical protein J3459_017597 [Metarhizium acridum]|nr:hypothetical protein J3459_017597 [Metarhizium acridum]